MSKEEKIKKAKFIKGLYLYSHRETGENLVRGTVWIVSLVLGIWINQISLKNVASDPSITSNSANITSLGGAYFIYGISLLLEFVPEQKDNHNAQMVHGIFCFLLFSMMLIGLFLSIGANAVGGEHPALISGSHTLLTIISIIVFICFVISLFLVLIKAHRFFYDEESERKIEKEREEKEKQDLFYKSLEIKKEGNNT